MAKLVYALNQSLDGYIDHMAFRPGPGVFRHFMELMREQAGSLYGRRMYEIMRCRDDDEADWGEEEKAFAIAWRGQPKWVVSNTLTEVGPNVTLLADDVEATLGQLKERLVGEIEVAGAVLAANLGEMGLIDEYRLYLHPVVLGRGNRYFARARPPLRLEAVDRIDADVVRLTYVPA